jgi:hypothetical protein
MPQRHGLAGTLPGARLKWWGYPHTRTPMPYPGPVMGDSPPRHPATPERAPVGSLRYGAFPDVAYPTKATCGENNHP